MSAELPAWEYEEYIETTWGELVELKYGKGLKGYKNAVGEFPVYGTNGPVGFCDKALCHFPSVIIGRKGAYRGVHYSGRPFHVIDTAYFIFPKYDINLKWAYYSLLTQDINGLDSGSAIPSTRREDFYAMPAKVPPRAEQDKIVENLDCFNSKIELNRQTNQTLEQIAQAIFKSWFVDFEPTRAKIAAKHYGQTVQNGEGSAAQREALLCDYRWPEAVAAAIATGDPERAAMSAISGKSLEELDQLSPEAQQQLKTTAALFPDALVESELGEIPKGWRASTLGEHFNVVMGQSPNGDTYNEEGEGMLFFQGRRDFGFRYPTPRVYTTEPKRLAQAGDTLISVRAPVGDRNLANQECCLGRGVAGIRHKSGARSFTYAFIGHIEKNLSDSGSDGTVFSSINKNELGSVGFVAPNNGLLNIYESQVYPIDQRVEVNSKESEALKGLRDSLLPKLLSGGLEANQPLKEVVNG